MWQSGCSLLIANGRMIRQFWTSARQPDAIGGTSKEALVHGRDELRADFLKGLESFSIEQNLSSAEVVAGGGSWAFEIAEVES